MGRRKKRRKRRRAEERAEENQFEQGSSGDEQEEEASSFGFMLRSTQKEDPNEPQYDDEPWWAAEEDYDLDDWEEKQYGEYKELPPPIEPEHLREPEPTRKEKAVEPQPSRWGRGIAAFRSGMGAISQRFRKVDWELVWLRVHEFGSNARGAAQHVIDEARFRNLQLAEKTSPQIRLGIYVALVLLLIGIPAGLGFFLFGTGEDTNTAGTSIALSGDEQPQLENTRVVQKPSTAVPQVAVAPTQAPVILPTSTPIPPTPIPPTPLPTNPPPTAIPPTPIPVAIASFFTPHVQRWALDIQQWSQQFGVDANTLAMAMQLETCGNPVYANGDRLGIFGVPQSRYAAGESYSTPADSARRAAELLQECTTLSGGDPGKTMVCYHGGTETMQTDFGQWSEEDQAVFLWSLGMTGDLQTGAQESVALYDWLVNGGGFDTCNQAQAALEG